MEIFLLGLALSLDAALASFAISLLHERESRLEKIKNAVLISLLFGFFQGLMLWIGSYGGQLLTFSSFGHLFQFIVGIIFFGLGLKCFQEGLKSEMKEIHWGFIPMLLLAFATSVDALVAGIGLGTLPQSHLVSAEIGLLTSIMAILFYFSAQFFEKIPDRYLWPMAGIIFTFLGIKIFWKLKDILI